MDNSTLVVSEPRTYGLDSPHSYIADLIATTMNGDEVRGKAARERLQRHAQETAVEVDAGTPEGRYVARSIRERVRANDPDVHRRNERDAVREFRAFASGGGALASAASGGSVFVTPYFVLSEWAPYRGIARSFADQCHALPMPDYGMQVYVPYFSSASGVGQQTEGSAVTETDPTSAFQSGSVVTLTGQLTGSQQVIDRAYTGGGAIDAVLFRQLAEQLDQQVDAYALTQVIANATVVTGQGSYTTANLYQDVAKAREVLTDTAGTRLRPTHLFTTSDLYSFASRQVDSQQRPIVTPKFAPGFPIATGADDGQQGQGARPKWSRFTGTILPGGVLWFTNDNIPTVGTTSQTQILVSAPDEAVLLLEAPPVMSVFPQTYANQLQCLLNLRSYVAVVTRHASGTATVQGAAYTTALV